MLELAPAHDTARSLCGSSVYVVKHVRTIVVLAKHVDRKPLSGFPSFMRMTRKVNDA